MTDAHVHLSAKDPSVREFLIGRDFLGLHPWETDSLSAAEVERRMADIRAALVSDPALGVGEIGLDRLRSRDISDLQRTTFERLLALAVELRRPVVLHGAKCWGQVVKSVRECGRQGGFLFHGFSRSDGLIPEIVALGGYLSVGPAVLNDHAVNYRELVKLIPSDRILVETDRTESSAAESPSLADVLVKTAEIRGVSAADFAALTDANASRFLASI